MKTWICTTLVNFFGPTEGAARLFAYIKSKGKDVSLKDFNQDIYFKILSEKYLNDSIEISKARLFAISRDSFLRKNIGSVIINNSNNYIKKLIAGGMLGGTGCPTEKILSSIIGFRINNGNIFYALLGNYKRVIAEIEKARKILDKHWLSLPYEEFLHNFQILLCGKAIIDMAYFPAQLDFGLGFEGSEYDPRVKDILRAVKDNRHNFLIPYYTNEVMPMVEKERPKIIGISITHTSEFIPAFTLAYIVKSRYPDVHICLGGATITEMAYKIQKNRKLWSFFDSIITGPGEYAFNDLIEHIEKNKDLSDVPNLIYKKGSEIKKSKTIREFNLNDACTPEFVSLRPKSILPLETSSGCYWGKCIFCYYPKGGLSDIEKTENVRVRRTELFLNDIKKLKKLYDPLYIGITDSALSVSRMEQIAEQNLKSKDPVCFSSFFRFEKEFMSEKFCKKISDGGFLGGQVGLESGSQRVNDIINKGVKIEDAEVVLKNFYKFGMLVHLYSLIGLPGETEQEAQMTFDFIKRNRRFLTLDWQIYSLRVLEHSPMLMRAKELGLEAETLPEDFLVQVMRYKLQKGMSQEQSTSMAIKFSEKLKKNLNPLHNIMDIESYKAVLLAKKAKNKEKIFK